MDFKIEAMVNSPGIWTMYIGSDTFKQGTVTIVKNPGHIPNINDKIIVKHLNNASLVVNRVTYDYESATVVVVCD